MEKKNKKVKMSKVFPNQEEMTSEEAFFRAMNLRNRRRAQVKQQGTQEKENKKNKFN